jgi:hypothetical protein
MFLVFTNIIRKFELRAPDDHPSPPLTADEGHIRYPKPYYVVPYPMLEENE